MLRLIGFYDYTVILTYLSLFSAVAGMHLASHDRIGFAVLCLILSGVCDAFDGIVARSKKNRTEDEKAFGVQIDSLCDAISFGVFPAVLSYHMGACGLVGMLCLFAYVLCAVIRLAFFNVLEHKRQQQKGGCNKTYRGLPVTTASVIFPLVYLLSQVMNPALLPGVLCIVCVVTAFLFVLDFSVKKPDWLKILKIRTKV